MAKHFSYSNIIKYYNDNSTDLATRYAALDPQKLHGTLIPILDAEIENKTGQFLEIGGGIGRDAAFFAERYHKNVYVVEPAQYLVTKSVRYLHDKGFEDVSTENKVHTNCLEVSKNGDSLHLFLMEQLPELSRVSAHQKDGMVEPFSFINVNAVWQHIHPEDRKESADKLSSLLAEGGIISVKGRKQVSDEQKNVAWETTIDELREQFSGLEVIIGEEQPDHSKPGSTLTFVNAIFRKPSL